LTLTRVWLNELRFYKANRNRNRILLTKTPQYIGTYYKIKSNQIDFVITTSIYFCGNLTENHSLWAQKWRNEKRTCLEESCKIECMRKTYNSQYTYTVYYSKTSTHRIFQTVYAKRNIRSFSLDLTTQSQYSYRHKIIYVELSKQIQWTEAMKVLLLECVIQRGAHILPYDKTDEIWQTVNTMFFSQSKRIAILKEIIEN